MDATRVILVLALFFISNIGSSQQAEGNKKRIHKANLKNGPVQSQQLKCYNCVVSVNTPSYVECKTLSSIKEVTCPAGSTGCAVVRDHPKGKFAEFRRECIGKDIPQNNTNSYCESRKKNDSNAKYFSCITCQGDGCNKTLLK